MRPFHRGHSNRAFTIVELLVVLMVIGVLLGLLLPAVQQARETSRRSKCQNNLKQIGLALQNYHNAYQAFPPVLTHHSRVSPQTGWLEGWWTWYVRILPFVAQTSLYNQIDLAHDAAGPFVYAQNQKQVSQNLSFLLSPSDQYGEKLWSADWGYAAQPLIAAHTNYLGCRGSTRNVPGDGVFPATNISKRLSDITDGTSQTLLAGERPLDEVGEWGWWALGTGFDEHGLADHVLACSDGLYKGVPGSSDDLTHFWSPHPGGAYFVFGDGSVKFLHYSINHDTFLALGSRNGREAPGEF
ncbi:MAG: DUF1559 domain-containing protein [Planctomycetes bacterium]|nr:DUF1559 domain-containing protein [Planctomycetota bacterium]